MILPTWSFRPIAQGQQYMKPFIPSGPFEELIKTHEVKLREHYAPSHIDLFEQMIIDNDQLIMCMICDYLDRCRGARLRIPVQVFLDHLKERFNKEKPNVDSGIVSSLGRTRKPKRSPSKS
jgi:hypothetical protein